MSGSEIDRPASRTRSHSAIPESFLTAESNSPRKMLTRRRSALSAIEEAEASPQRRTRILTRLSACPESAADQAGVQSETSSKDTPVASPGSSIPNKLRQSCVVALLANDEKIPASPKRVKKTSIFCTDAPLRRSRRLSSSDISEEPSTMVTPKYARKSVLPSASASIIEEVNEEEILRSDESELTRDSMPVNLHVSSSFDEVELNLISSYDDSVNKLEKNLQQENREGSVAKAFSPELQTVRRSPRNISVKENESRKNIYSVTIPSSPTNKVEKVTDIAQNKKVLSENLNEKENDTPKTHLTRRSTPALDEVSLNRSVENIEKCNDERLLATNDSVLNEKLKSGRNRNEQKDELVVCETVIDKPKETPKLLMEGQISQHLSLVVLEKESLDVSVTNGKRLSKTMIDEQKDTPKSRVTVLSSADSLAEVFEKESLDVSVTNDKLLSKTTIDEQKDTLKSHVTVLSSQDSSPEVFEKESLDVSVTNDKLLSKTMIDEQKDTPKSRVTVLSSADSLAEVFEKESLDVSVTSDKLLSKTMIDEQKDTPKSHVTVLSSQDTSPEVLEKQSLDVSVTNEKLSSKTMIDEQKDTPKSHVTVLSSQDSSPEVLEKELGDVSVTNKKLLSKTMIDEQKDTPKSRIENQSLQNVSPENEPLHVSVSYKKHSPEQVDTPKTHTISKYPETKSPDVSVRNQKRLSDIMMDKVQDTPKSHFVSQNSQDSIDISDANEKHLSKAIVDEQKDALTSHITSQKSADSTEDIEESLGVSVIHRQHFSKTTFENLKDTLKLNLSEKSTNRSPQHQGSLDKSELEKSMDEETKDKLNTPSAHDSLLCEHKETLNAIPDKQSNAYKMISDEQSDTTKADETLIDESKNASRTHETNTAEQKDELTADEMLIKNASQAVEITTDEQKNEPMTDMKNVIPKTHVTKHSSIKSPQLCLTKASEFGSALKLMSDKKIDFVDEADYMNTCPILDDSRPVLPAVKTDTAETNSPETVSCASSDVQESNDEIFDSNKVPTEGSTVNQSVKHTPFKLRMNKSALDNLEVDVSLKSKPNSIRKIQTKIDTSQDCLDEESNSMQSSNELTEYPGKCILTVKHIVVLSSDSDSGDGFINSSAIDMGEGYQSHDSMDDSEKEYHRRNNIDEIGEYLHTTDESASDGEYDNDSFCVDDDDALGNALLVGSGDDLSLGFSSNDDGDDLKRSPRSKVRKISSDSSDSSDDNIKYSGKPLKQLNYDSSEEDKPINKKNSNQAKKAINADTAKSGKKVMQLVSDSESPCFSSVSEDEIEEKESDFPPKKMADSSVGSTKEVCKLLKTEIKSVQTASKSNSVSEDEIEKGSLSTLKENTKSKPGVTKEIQTLLQTVKNLSQLASKCDALSFISVSEDEIEENELAAPLKKNIKEVHTLQETDKKLSQSTSKSESTCFNDVSKDETEQKDSLSPLSKKTNSSLVSTKELRHEKSLVPDETNELFTVTAKTVKEWGSADKEVSSDSDSKFKEEFIRMLANENITASLNREKKKLNTSDISQNSSSGRNRSNVWTVSDVSDSSPVQKKQNKSAVMGTTEMKSPATPHKMLTSKAKTKLDIDDSSSEDDSMDNELVLAVNVDFSRQLKRNKDAADVNIKKRKRLGRGMSMVDNAEDNITVQKGSKKSKLSKNVPDCLESDMASSQSISENHFADDVKIKKNKINTKTDASDLSESRLEMIMNRCNTILDKNEEIKRQIRKEAGPKKLKKKLKTDTRIKNSSLTKSIGNEISQSPAKTALQTPSTTAVPDTEKTIQPEVLISDLKTNNRKKNKSKTALKTPSTSAVPDTEKTIQPEVLISDLKTNISKKNKSKTALKTPSTSAVPDTEKTIQPEVIISDLNIRKKKKSKTVPLQTSVEHPVTILKETVSKLTVSDPVVVTSEVQVELQNTELKSKKKRKINKSKTEPLESSVEQAVQLLKETVTKPSVSEPFVVTSEEPVELAKKKMKKNKSKTKTVETCNEQQAELLKETSTKRGMAAPAVSENTESETKKKNKRLLGLVESTTSSVELPSKLKKSKGDNQPGFAVELLKGTVTKHGIAETVSTSSEFPFELPRSLAESKAKRKNKKKLVENATASSTERPTKFLKINQRSFGESVMPTKGFEMLKKKSKTKENENNKRKKPVADFLDDFVATIEQPAKRKKPNEWVNLPTARSASTHLLLAKHSNKAITERKTVLSKPSWMPNVGYLNIDSVGNTSIPSTLGGTTNFVIAVTNVPPKTTVSTFKANALSAGSKRVDISHLAKMKSKLQAISKRK